MIKAQSLEIMLMMIILFITSISLPEQDTTKKGWRYKNIAIYKHATQLKYEMIYKNVK